MAVCRLPLLATAIALLSSTAHAEDLLVQNATYTLNAGEALSVGPLQIRNDLPPPPAPATDWQADGLFQQAGGTLIANSMSVVGSWSLYGDRAAFQQSSGSSSIDTELSVKGDRASFSLTGGALSTKNLQFFDGSNGSLSSGELSTQRTEIGAVSDWWGQQASFQQTGGTHKTVDLAVNHDSSYQLQAGVLDTQTSLVAGSLAQGPASTHTTRQLTIGTAGNYTNQNGTLIAGEFNMWGSVQFAGSYWCSPGPCSFGGTFTQQGGSTTLQHLQGSGLSTLELQGGQIDTQTAAIDNTLHQSGGLLTSGSMEVNSGAIDPWFSSGYWGGAGLVQTGGEHRAELLRVGEYGRASISGGKLSTQQLEVIGQLNQDGGTLLAPKLIMQGQRAEFIKNGGDTQADIIRLEGAPLPVPTEPGENFGVFPAGWTRLVQNNGHTRVQGHLSAHGMSEIQLNGGSIEADSVEIDANLGLNGGQLSSQTTTVHNGRTPDTVLNNPEGGIIQTAGTHQTGLLTLQQDGLYQLQTGVLDAQQQDLHGQLEQSGGQNHAAEIRIDASGQYDLKGGLLKASQIAVQSGGEFNFSGGVLSVDNFQGNLSNDGGQLSPGSSPGTTHITGDYTQASTGSMLIEWGAGAYDQVVVDGVASLGGKLTLTLWENYLPSNGDSIVLLMASSLTGKFDDFIAPIVKGYTFALDYGTNAVSVHVSVDPSEVPLPGAWAFMLSGLGMLGATRRRARS